MRECKLILPKHDNDGRVLGAAHADLCRALLDSIGGYTCIHGAGAWRNPETGRVFNEEVVTYVVAVDPQTDHVEFLRALAAAFKVDAQREAVYFVGPDGGVEFL